MPNTEQRGRNMDTAAVIAFFKLVLKKLGYKNVKIKKTELPPHVLEFGRGDDNEMTNEEVAEVMPYFRVTSNLGSFGIVIGARILLDIKESGVSAGELGEKNAAEDLILLPLNSVTMTLLHLKQQLNTLETPTLVN